MRVTSYYILFRNETGNVIEMYKLSHGNKKALSHPMGVLNSFCVKNIFYKMDLRLFYFSVTKYTEKKIHIP